MKSKKRFLFMAVVVALVLCMAGTAAAAEYGEAFLASALDDHIDSIGTAGYVRDQNTRSYFQSGGGEYNSTYTSKGYCRYAGYSNWNLYSSILNSSGSSKTHDYTTGVSADGRLGFYNSQHPGYYFAVNGTVTIVS
jgi:hypothetical protein